jgi:hypothetical protein
MWPLVYFGLVIDPFQRLLRLSPEPRPHEVGDWLRGRKYTERFIPIVDDLHRYREEWIGWWTASQPKWRCTQSWPFPKDSGGDGSWDSFPARGQNGIFLAIMATSWWARVVDSAEDLALFEEAVDDVHWVIQECIRNYSSPSTSNQPPPPTLGSWSRTFSRGDGKRTVKPSRRARDAL